MTARILIADDEESMREFLEILLLKEGYEVLLASDAPEAIELAKKERPDLIITDLRMGTTSGLEVLEGVKAFDPACEIVMISAFATTENAILAMKLGAYDYITKPFKVDEISVVVSKALEKRALVTENRALRSQLSGGSFAGLISRSQRMSEVFHVVEKVAPTRTTVLVTGESGVGKELVARAVHQKSPRADGPFVAVNCGAIPEGLLESELFGHVRGAFTGASVAKTGLFQAASQGTLFLDEVGELPLAVQVKLLRALQDRRVKAVGGVEDEEVDTRIVAATNRDLAAEVKAGRFREDLYYRLNVVQIKVPPLRERREDVLLLAEHFLAKVGKEQGLSNLSFSPDAIRALGSHSFPGNVRELENAVERAVTLAESETISESDLPSALRGANALLREEVGEIPAGFDLQLHLDDIERQFLERALEQSGGVRQDAAKLLGLSFRSYRYRLKKLGSDEEDEETG